MVRAKESITLIEVMMVSLIILIVALALWKVYISSLALTIQAKEMNIAVDDVKDVMEKLKNVNFPDIPTVFPDGGSVSSNMIGEFLLKNESIVVSYPGGDDSDPLQIQVQISWTGKDGRSYSEVFKTIRTSRL